MVTLGALSVGAVLLLSPLFRRPEKRSEVEPQSVISPKREADARSQKVATRLDEMQLAIRGIEERVASVERSVSRTQSAEPSAADSDSLTAGPSAPASARTGREGVQRSP